MVHCRHRCAKHQGFRLWLAQINSWKVPSHPSQALCHNLLCMRTTSISSPIFALKTTRRQQQPFSTIICCRVVCHGVETPLPEHQSSLLETDCDIRRVSFLHGYPVMSMTLSFGLQVLRACPFFTGSVEHLASLCLQFLGSLTMLDG